MEADIPSLTEAGFDRLAARAAAEAPAPPRPKGAPVHFEPLGDCILVERVAVEEDAKVGSIYLPDSAQEKPTECDVVAIGPGRLDHAGNLQPVAVAVGDRILIAKWSGTEVKIDGYEFLLLKHDEILGRRR